MPNLIIGNVDNESMVGDLDKLTIEQQRESSKVANRLIWLMRPGDIIILPRPIGKKYLSYVCRVLNINIKSIQIIVPNHHNGGQAQLTFDVLCNHELITEIKRAMNSSQHWNITTYYYDRSVAWLTEALGIKTNRFENSFFMQAGAEQFNSKADFCTPWFVYSLISLIAVFALIFIKLQKHEPYQWSGELVTKKKSKLDIA